MNVRFPTVEAKWSMSYQLQVNSLVEQAFDKINEYAFVPGGGAQGQILAKVSARSYDVTWVNYPSTGIPYRAPVAAFSVAQSDGGSVIYCGGAGGYTVTLPALPDTTAVKIVNNSSAAITLSPSGIGLYWYTGAAIATGPRTLAVGGVATIHLVGAAWRIWATGIS